MKLRYVVMSGTDRAMTCTECGAAVSNEVSATNIHDDWHEHMNRMARLLLNMGLEDPDVAEEVVKRMAGDP